MRPRRFPRAYCLGLGCSRGKINPRLPRSSCHKKASSDCLWRQETGLGWTSYHQSLTLNFRARPLLPFYLFSLLFEESLMGLGGLERSGCGGGVRAKHWRWKFRKFQEKASKIPPGMEPVRGERDELVEEVRAVPKISCRGEVIPNQQVGLPEPGAWRTLLKQAVKLLRCQYFPSRAVCFGRVSGLRVFGLTPRVKHPGPELEQTAPGPPAHTGGEVLSRSWC